MKVVGLIGGIASGKSRVAEDLVARGAGSLNADRIAHEVLREPEIKAAARRRWGPGIFDSEGEIQRSQLAGIVFGDDEQAMQERAYLESLVHPRVRQRMEEKLANWRSAGDCPLALIDAPLLLEAKLDRICDEVWFIDAPTEVRCQRARARGWSEEEFFAREQAQQTLDLKRRRADRIILNGEDWKATQAQLSTLWQQIVLDLPHCQS